MYTCAPAPDVTRIRTVRVTAEEELAAALEPLRAHDYLAVDTEFMRERTYYPKLCLLQLANAGGCVVIDPFAVARLDAVKALLADRRYTKILHASRQDVEVLSIALELIPGPVFDTQIAAGLLGLPAQIGYGELVRQRLGHELPKAQARTDWARRPLTEAQLDYAADDVRYLALLYADLCRALQAARRLEWLFEETAALENPALYETRPVDAWRRLKGLDRLNAGQRAAASSLAQWRERIAQEADRPRGWILPDDALRAIAERLPRSGTALEAIANLPPAVARKRGPEIVELVEEAVLQAAEVELARPARPEPAQMDRVARLMRLVRGEAQRLSISQELLATRRDIERLVFSGDAGPLGRGWRHEVIGRALLEAI